MTAAVHPQDLPDAWFALALDTHAALASAAQEASAPAPGLEIWSPQAVAVRLLMRTCGNLEAAVVLTRQGLVAEGRTLARSLIENSFAVAALVEQPTAYVEMLKDDSERSRRNQGTFLLQHMPNSGGDRNRLQQAIDGIDKSCQFIKQKDLALGAPLAGQYLWYLRLSDDAAHVSARSLEHHVTRADGGWTYRAEPGTPEENASTLHYALLAALGVGVGVSQVLGAHDLNAALVKLSERFSALPPVQAI